MTVLHTVLHATAFVWNDPRRDVRKLWPTDTEVRAHDIVVAGRSLTDLARERRTPCVLIAPTGPSAVHPEVDAHVTLVVAKIIARHDPHGWHRDVVLTLDCTLGALAPLVTHIDLLHAPRARDLAPMTLQTASDSIRLKARLPRASSPGDLVVFACTGTLSLSQVVPRESSFAERDDADETEATGRACRRYQSDAATD